MNWKTTLAGVLAAIGQVLATPGVLPAPWHTVAQALAAIGLALLGYSAADKQPAPTLSSPKASN